MLALIMRNKEPVSSLAEKCFADAQVILANASRLTALSWPSATG